MSKTTETTTTTTVNGVTTTVTTTTTTVDASKKEAYEFLVVDRSGSMSGIWDSTIKGVNEYINKAKVDAEKLGIKTFVSVLLFDNDFIMQYDFVDVSKVSALDPRENGPRGGTALNDATGRAIKALEARLAGREASDSVDVNLTVHTDGDENSSREFTGYAIKTLISKAKEQYKWNINYVGAGPREQVLRTATSLGFEASNVASYEATDAGVSHLLGTMELSRSVKMSNFSKGVKTSSGYFAPEVAKIETEEKKEA